MKYEVVSVIGPSVCPPEIYSFGEELGRGLAHEGKTIVCGGMFGLMEAVCKGAQSSPRYQKNTTIGITPGYCKTESNSYCDVVIPTGIGFARNQLVVNAGDVVVAVAGGSGTLSEIAFAWQFGKTIIAYEGFGGWSEKMAGQVLDEKRGGFIHTAKSVEEIIRFVCAPV